jgi:hypothetical protein
LANSTCKDVTQTQSNFFITLISSTFSITIKEQMAYTMTIPVTIPSNTNCLIITLLTCPVQGFQQSCYKGGGQIENPHGGLTTDKCMKLIIYNELGTMKHTSEIHENIQIHEKSPTCLCLTSNLHQLTNLLLLNRVSTQNWTKKFQNISRLNMKNHSFFFISSSINPSISWLKSILDNINQPF